MVSETENCTLHTDKKTTYSLFPQKKGKRESKKYFGVIPNGAFQTGCLAMENNSSAFL